MKYLKYIGLFAILVVLAACGQNAAPDEELTVSDIVRTNNIGSVVDGTRIVEVFQFRNQNVNYRIVIANNDPNNPVGDPRGCNVNVDNPATIKFIDVPEGVTVTPSSLTFTKCASAEDPAFQTVTFSSPTLGDYPITVDPDVEGGIEGSKWAIEADFILHVKPLSTVTLDPSAPDGDNGWYTSDVNAAVTGLNVRCVLQPAAAPPPTNLAIGCTYSLPSGQDVTEDGEWTLYSSGRVNVDGTLHIQPIQSQSFKIDKTPPVVTCDTPAPSFTVGQDDANVGASVSDTGSGPAAASVSAAVDVTNVGSGQVSVTGYDKAGNSASQECSYEVIAGTPDFAFDLSELPAKTFGDAPFSVASYASTNSTGAITFALGSSSSGCSVTSAGQVTITGAATGGNSCVIEASLAADSNYDAAGPVSQQFQIARAAGSVSINNMPRTAIIGGTFTPVYTRLGDGVASTTAGPTSVCTVSGGVVSYVGAGACQVQASVAEGSNHLATTGAVQSFNIYPTPFFLALDEEAISKGTAPNFFTDPGINESSTTIGQRAQLAWFRDNVGRVIDLPSGQVGDEGWFALKTIPSTWNAAGPTAIGERNLHLAGPGLGSPDAKGNRETLLDSISNVTPLRATGLRQLIGQSVCAIVWKSDISINYGPLRGNLKGTNRGVVAFGVREVKPFGTSSTLPRVSVEVLDANTVCAAALTLHTNAPTPTSSTSPMDTGR